MSSLWYVEKVGVVAKIGTALTVFFNSLLVYLTIGHIRDVTAAYKFLIILLAVIGMIFSIMEHFVHPFIHSFDASFLYFSIDRMFGASRSVKTWMILTYSELYVIIICLIAVQFVYRLWIMSNSNYLCYFHGYKAMCWLLYFLVACLIWGTSVIQCLPDAVSMEYLREEILTEYDTDVTEVSGYFIVAYESVNGVRTLRWNSIVFIVGTSFVLFSQYIVIVYCIVKIQQRLKFLLALTSSKKHQLQSQLFKTLVIQISAPSLFYHIPVFLLFFVPYFDLKMSIPSGIMICFFSIYPALDSVILMWMFVEYRRILRKPLVNCLRKLLTVLEKKCDKKETSMSEPSKTSATFDNAF